VFAEEFKGWRPIRLIRWRWRKIEREQDVVDGRFAVVDIGGRGDGGAWLERFRGRVGLGSRDVDFIAVSAFPC
jgi:hypothetical protein